jgi:hypothetical protein
MTYFADLSLYSYDRHAPVGLVQRNVGWLGSGIDFQTKTAEPEFLERLWQHCFISISQTRGLYQCHLCDANRSNVAESGGKQLLLGSAEIRVFSRQGDIYAAPNLVYHYVSEHGYSPPAEFEQAVRLGLSPSSREYFDRLSQLGMSWTSTLTPDPNTRRFKFVKTADGVKKVEE